MSIQQSYKNVADGANSARKTSLLNNAGSKIHISYPLRDALSDPETVQSYRTMLRSWFLNYLQHQDDQLNVHDLGENSTLFEFLDDWFSQIIDLHLGWYLEPVYPLKKPVEDVDLLAISVKMREVFDRQAELSRLLFEANASVCNGDHSTTIAEQIDRDIEQCRTMIEDIENELSE